MSKSKFSLPKLVTVKMLYHNIDREPDSETKWVSSWRVPLSKRIADQDEWRSIIGKLG